MEQDRIPLTGEVKLRTAGRSTKFRMSTIRGDDCVRGRTDEVGADLPLRTTVGGRKVNAPPACTLNGSGPSFVILLTRDVNRDRPRVRVFGRIPVRGALALQRVRDAALRAVAQEWLHERLVDVLPLHVAGAGERARADSPTCRTPRDPESSTRPRSVRGPLPRAERRIRCHGKREHQGPLPR